MATALRWLIFKRQLPRELGIRHKQVTDALPFDDAPRYMIRYRDGAIGPAFTRRIRAMGIRGHPIAPRSPWQNGQVEQLIGSNPSRA